MKRNYLPALLVGMLLLLPLHGAAAEHTYAGSDKTAVISVGQVEVTPEELEQADHLVPVIVRMYPNPGFNVLEFGISSTLPYEVLTPDGLDPDTERGAMLCALPTAPANLRLLFRLFSESRDVGDEHVTWFAYGTPDAEKPRNLAVLLVRVPQSAQPGDSFAIHFLSESVTDSEETPGLPAYCNRWDEEGNLFEYQKIGEFEGFSGSITITEPKTTEPPTEPPTTEPPPEYTLGDVNVNGSINSEDAALVLQASARIGTVGTHGLTKAQFAAADTNRDQVVSAKDAAEILRYAARIGTGFQGAMEEYLGY